MIRIVGNFHPFGISKLSDENGISHYRLETDGNEICWNKNEIIWSKFSCLLHHFHLPGDVMDSATCNIMDEKYLAVLYNSGLTLFDISGESFLIPLPFQMEKLFPLHKSLLLFRSKSSILMHEQYKNFPVLFTLFHVLEEIRPVAFLKPKISTPIPKYTTISSPRAKQNKEEDFSYIIDLDFNPLMVLEKRAYLLASANNYLSVWSFKKTKQNRDLLFTSPRFVRSPSIFSPPPASIMLNSPRSDTKDDLKETLEGIPPDLYMNMIFEFDQEYEKDSYFLDLSDEQKKIILVLNNHVLNALDLIFYDSANILFTINDVECICEFKKLMYFVVLTNGDLVLYNENKVIIHLPFKNVKKIQKYGKKYICFFNNNDDPIIFYFEISFKDFIYSIIDVAYFALSLDCYSNLLLSLSESNSFLSYNNFVNNFLDLLCKLASKEEIQKFISILHLLFEEIRIQRNKTKELEIISKILIELSIKTNLYQYILYYLLHSQYKINDITFENIYLEQFPLNIDDIMNWCSLCIKGSATVGFPLLFPFSSKLCKTLTLPNSINNFCDIVENADHAKLKLNDLENIQPGINYVLKNSFRLTAKNPPSSWPLAAYKLIGREDIKLLHEYLDKGETDNVLFYEQPDLRFIEVERLLQSSLPLTVDVERPNGIDDIKFQSMLVQRLKTLLEKQWSLSIGRSLFNIQTFHPLISQSIVTKEINIYGYTYNGEKLTPGDDYLTDEILEWPQFHNGVSDSLTVIKAEHNWIMDIISKDTTPYTAGVVYGFGVSGLLKKLWKSDYFQYFDSTNMKTINVISLILGLGICYRGTKDMSISQMISRYVPSLSFTNFEEEPSQLIQASSIIGLGFLYESSCQRNLTEAFMKIIEISSSFENPIQSFAAGISIGLINLGQGDKSIVFKDIREKLCSILNGNKSDDYSGEKIITFGNTDFYSVSPSVILALTLGYLSTNNERIKRVLSLPEDPSFVNSMLPDIVLLRTMGSLLIDSDPSKSLNFIITQGLEPNILASVVTGFAIACGIKNAGTLNIKAYERIFAIAKCLCLLEKTPFDFTDCNTSLRENYLSVVILSCSLIIAGTCKVSFLRFIRYVRRRQISTNSQQFVYGFHTILSMAIGVLNMGKGRFTLGRDNSQIASILISIYPRLSRHISDNDFYLQPLRYLITTASIPRVLEIRDADTNKIVNILTSIGINDGTELPLNTPHVLPPFETITFIKINNNKYYNINLEPNPFTNNFIRPIIWVKKINNEEKIQELNLENLRIVLKMFDNPIFKNEIQKPLSFEVEKYRNILEWDEHSSEIINFFRSNSFQERVIMLQNNQIIKNFLLFYGISPSAQIKNLYLFEDEALSFLIPYLNENEINQI